MGLGRTGRLAAQEAGLLRDALVGRGGRDLLTLGERTTRVDRVSAAPHERGVSVRQALLQPPEYPVLQVMRYMGNKRSVLPFLIPILREKADRGEIVLDLFSGTCSVGYALKPTNVIYANDIQQYSTVISRALLSRSFPIASVKQAHDDLDTNYEDNLTRLFTILNPQLTTEADFLSSKPSHQLFNRYKNFCEYYPHHNGERGRGKLGQLFTTSIDRRRTDPLLIPFILFSSYFGNSYFGVRQCAEIDSLRRAIEEVKSLTRRGFYLTCLISALSNSVSSTGHFAEYRRLNSLDSCKDLLIERRKSVHDLFFQAVSANLHAFETGASFPLEDRSFNLDYRRLLTAHADVCRNAAVVYADPPYSSAHYSRFYHVLETLVRYDYPKNDFVGRYRHDRPSSGFCRYSSVDDEFRMLGKLVSLLGCSLVISYSDKGMVSIKRIAELVGPYFKRTPIIHQKAYSHSRQGRPSRVDLHEFVLVFSDPIDKGGHARGKDTNWSRTAS